MQDSYWSFDENARWTWRLYVGSQRDKCTEGAWVEPSGGLTRVAVAEGPRSYVWLEEARVTGHPGKPILSLDILRFT